MGFGGWDTTAYNAASTYRATHGIDDFTYSSTTRATVPRSSWKTAPELDPRGVIRECRDSDEHPDSLPVVVLFDVTGSMGTVPKVMQSKLGKLHGLLQRRGYAKDPQILFGAIGDADSDRAPLQVGQFESDNAMDEQLRLVLLEGGGGGQQSESYELAAYFVAEKTVTDAWEKRGRRGYFFVIGDEMNKPRVSRAHIEQVLGDTVPEHLSVEDTWRKVQERWDTYFVLPKGTSYFDDPAVNQHWQSLLGQNFLKLEDPAAVCELIALTIGLGEDAVDLDSGLSDLVDAGSAAESGAVGRALAVVGSSRSGASSAVAKRDPAGALAASADGGDGDDLDFGDGDSAE